MNIIIPEEVRYIIDTLESNGYEAYAVGGCVRDSISGTEPKDWDICTPALPEQTIKFFAGHNIIETGLQHGTITLRINHKSFEVTTYRVDGVYTDNRRPDKVGFVNDLRTDLSRRDFTVNAMAYNPEKGIIDFFGGVKDLNSGIIKCVGDPNKRFQEDALRIMRAMRFASVLGFEIENKTSQAMLENKNLLQNISAERISAELNKMITGKNIRNILSRHISVIAEIIPEISAVTDFIGFTGLENIPAAVALRLTMLFCDINIESETAKKILRRLKYDRKTVETVSQLILYYGFDILTERKHIKKWLNRIGEERFRQLLEIKKADEIKFLLNEIIEQKQCFSLKDLALNGGDLIALKITESKKIGEILNKLLNMVIDEKIENDKIKLSEAVEIMLK